MNKNLAMAYAMKKKSAHMCHGGDCSHSSHYAKGGETGVNKTIGIRGRSEAGSKLIPAFSVFGKEHDIENSKEEHRKTLGELKSMPKPKLMAEGGNSSDEGPAIDPEKVKQFQKGFNSGDVSISDAINNAKQALGMADGGMMKSKKQRAMEAFHGMAKGGESTQTSSSNRRDQKGVHESMMPAAHLELEKRNEFASHPDSHNSSMSHPVMNQMGDEDEGAGDMDSIHPMVRNIMMGRMKGYSEGGKVANEESGESTDTDSMAKASGNEFDDLALRDDLEFDSTGANEGDELDNAREDKDRSDIIARILKSRAKKDRMPRPA